MQAEQTAIDVRVISRGAKFIGTSMGGVQITLHDARTGELLVQGKTRGGTGDTQRIMRESHGRNGVLATESAAVFSTRLDLDEPRLIEVRAYGPLAQVQSANTVTATQWVIPGKDLTGGNGWLLEMPGFVVDILDPPAHKGVTGLPRKIPVSANITKMCGCPLVPGGLWDADQYEISALVRHNGEFLSELPLEYAGETSRFAGTLTAEQPGSYEITVYAFDPETGNTGLDITTASNVSAE
ncbi:MAG: hypothetical protein U5P41_07510 [Gammaproteobacteria bacterium]|nr:hypothetical protein [Gammaproteobacteria bacterium]